MNKQKKKKKLSDRIIISVVVVITLMFFLIFAYMLLYVLVSSISTASMREGISLIPDEISLEGYRAVFEDKQIVRGLLNSILYTTVGTSVSMAVNIMTAYVLSSPQFKSGKIVMMLLNFSIYFNGGMIPTFLLVKKLHLLNSMWSLILPSCISVYNIYLMKTYFENKISRDLFDAARLDGCNHLKFILKVVLPIASDFLGVIALFFVISYWNTYFNAQIYITDMDKLPLANVLNSILIKNQTGGLGSGLLHSVSSVDAIQRKQLLDYALIVVSSTPIIVFFVLIKKHMKSEDLSVGIKL